MEKTKETKETQEEKKNIVEKTKQAILNAMDENGNGEIDIEDVIIKGLRIPGIKIDRANFLQKELFKRYSQEVIDKAILTTPAQANISDEDIEKISEEVIQFERVCVSGISTALGVPGGVAMVATAIADVGQYYGYMLRAAQKLLYLYGFPQIDTTEEGQKFDSETMNLLILCLGTMYGVAGANNALKVVARALARGVEKNLAKLPLTKGVIFPVVRKIASSCFAVKLTKTMYTKFFGAAIPVVGGVLGGALTYFSFKPCCEKLKESLKDTRLSKSDQDITDEIEFVEIEEVVESEE